MYATAQHVVSRAGAAGINGFLHRHGPEFSWPADTRAVALLPSATPGEEVSRHIVVPPGGNPVRSYLDLLAPHGTHIAELLSALREAEATVEQQLDAEWVVARGAVVIVFGVEGSLASARRGEFERLAAEVESLLVGELGDG